MKPLGEETLQDSNNLIILSTLLEWWKEESENQELLEKKYTLYSMCMWGATLII